MMDNRGNRNTTNVVYWLQPLIQLPQNFSSPWPRPGMQGLSSMDYMPEVLQLLYSVPAKSRQGRL